MDWLLQQEWTFKYFSNYLFFILFLLLLQASKTGHNEVVRLLIKNERCNINEKDKNGNTALHLGKYLNI